MNVMNDEIKEETEYLADMVTILAQKYITSYALDQGCNEGDVTAETAAVSKLAELLDITPEEVCSILRSECDEAYDIYKERVTPKEYSVTVDISGSVTLKVWARDEDEAYEIAEDSIDASPIYGGVELNIDEDSVEIDDSAYNCADCEIDDVEEV